MVEIRACGWNRQRFVVVISPRLTLGFSGCALNRGAPSKLCVIKTLQQPQQASRKRRKIRVFFFQCGFYTVIRNYSQKLVALKIIAAAGKYPDSCIVSLYRRTHWLLGNCTMSLSLGEQCPSQDHRTMRIRLLVSTKWLRRAS